MRVRTALAEERQAATGGLSVSSPQRSKGRTGIQEMPPRSPMRGQAKK